VTPVALPELCSDAAELIRRAYDLGRRDGRGDGLNAAAAWLQHHASAQPGKARRDIAELSMRMLREAVRS